MGQTFFPSLAPFGQPPSPTPASHYGEPPHVVSPPRPGMGKGAGGERVVALLHTQHQWQVDFLYRHTLWQERTRQQQRWHSFVAWLPLTRLARIP
jgi:hypothetical protein